MRLQGAPNYVYWTKTWCSSGLKTLIMRTFKVKALSFLLGICVCNIGLAVRADESVVFLSEGVETERIKTVKGGTCGCPHTVESCEIPWSRIGIFKDCMAIEKNAESGCTNEEVSTGADKAAPHLLDHDTTDWDRKLLQLINIQRKKGAPCGVGARPLPSQSAYALDKSLSMAAYFHAKDMWDKKYYSHWGKMEGTARPSDRATSAGFQGDMCCGENMARTKNMGTEIQPDAALTGWMASRPHCQNVMAAQFKRVGIGHYKCYVVVMFAGDDGTNGGATNGSGGEIIAPAMLPKPLVLDNTK